jgi:hypothetical protein
LAEWLPGRCSWTPPPPFRGLALGPPALLALRTRMRRVHPSLRDGPWLTVGKPARPANDAERSLRGADHDDHSLGVTDGTSRGHADPRSTGGRRKDDHVRPSSLQVGDPAIFGVPPPLGCWPERRWIVRKAVPGRRIVAAEDRPAFHAPSQRISTHASDGAPGQTRALPSSGVVLVRLSGKCWP